MLPGRARSIDNNNNNNNDDDDDDDDDNNNNNNRLCSIHQNYKPAFNSQLIAVL